LLVADLTEKDLIRRLAAGEFRLRTGPVVTAIRSPLPEVARGIHRLYSAHLVEDDDGFADFHVHISRPRGVRRWIKRQVVFQFDSAKPFYPLPGDQGFPILEWGLNWCVSTYYARYLVLHCAVLDRRGRALLLQGPPGAGKSTLTAGLVSRGWRLLSDELTLIDPRSGEITGLARPISLKNASIGVIRKFAPDADFSPTVHDTLKGSVAHMKPPEESVRRVNEPSHARWIVFPRYDAGAPSALEQLSRGRTFMRLADGAFNYDVHGRRGFDTLAQLIRASDCYEFRYGDLEDAARLFDRLAAS
jgi:HprK-related kinase A